MAEALTRDEWREITSQLAAPFPVWDVDFRVTKTIGNGEGLAVAYIDRGALVKRLDTVVGAENWTFDFEPLVVEKGPKGDSILKVAKGKLTIFGITKCDIGDAPDFEASKGCAADSEKRAAFQWQIGTYLADLKPLYVKCSDKGVIVPSEITRLRTELAAGRLFKEAAHAQAARAAQAQPAQPAQQEAPAPEAPSDEPAAAPVVEHTQPARAQAPAARPAQPAQRPQAQAPAKASAPAWPAGVPKPQNVGAAKRLATERLKLSAGEWGTLYNECGGDLDKITRKLASRLAKTDTATPAAPAQPSAPAAAPVAPARAEIPDFGDGDDEPASEGLMHTVRTWAKRLGWPEPTDVMTVADASAYLRDAQEHAQAAS